MLDPVYLEYSTKNKNEFSISMCSWTDGQVARWIYSKEEAASWD